MFSLKLVVLVVFVATVNAQYGGHHGLSGGLGQSGSLGGLSGGLGHHHLGLSSGLGQSGQSGQGSSGHHHGHAQSYIDSNVHLVHPVAIEFQDKHGHKDVDYHAHPHYGFKYGVEDGHTHDIKSQHETRDGDKVVGEYSLKEADGTTRTVKYVADKHTGFHAEVIRSGHAGHPHVYGHSEQGHGHY